MPTVSAPLFLHRSDLSSPGGAGVTPRSTRHPLHDWQSSLRLQVRGGSKSHQVRPPNHFLSIELTPFDTRLLSQLGNPYQRTAMSPPSTICRDIRSSAQVTAKSPATSISTVPAKRKLRQDLHIAAGSKINGNNAARYLSSAMLNKPRLYLKVTPSASALISRWLEMATRWVYRDRYARTDRPGERSLGIGHPFGAALPFDESGESVRAGKHCEPAAEVKPSLGVGGGQLGQKQPAEQGREHRDRQKVTFPAGDPF